MKIFFSFPLLSLIFFEICSFTPPPPTTTPPVKLKQVYYDWTDAIKQGLQDENVFSDFLKMFKGNESNLWGSSTPNILFSTDLLINDIANLTSSVIPLLHKNKLETFHLLPVFSADGISQFADIFHDPINKISEENLKVLKSHVRGIVLDYQSMECSSSPLRLPDQDFIDTKNNYYPGRHGQSIIPTDYNTKWHVSYPKYARSIVTRLLGQQNDVKIGVLFNNSYFPCLRQIIDKKQVDFFIKTVVVYPGGAFPLSYPIFKEFLNNENPYLTHRMPLFRFMKPPPTETTIEFHFKVQFEELDLKLFFRKYASKRHYFDDKDREIPKRIIDTAKPAYNSLIREYAGRWVNDSGHGNLILPFRLYNKNEASPMKTEMETLIPYLYEQEVDESDCQVASMLNKVAKSYSAMIVNEYTWNTIAKLDSYQHKCPQIITVSNTKPEILLFFSYGVAKSWDKKEAYFKNLLTNHKNSSYGWDLKTIVFTSGDVACKICEKNKDTESRGIVKFANEMKKANYDIGCLVKLSSFTGNLSSPHLFKRLGNVTRRECGALFKISKVIVWEVEIELERGIAYSFSLFNTYQDYQRMMIHLLVGRDRMKEESVGIKEVIVSVRFRGARKLMYLVDDVMYRRDRYNYPSRRYYYDDYSGGRNFNESAAAVMMTEVCGLVKKEAVDFYAGLLTFGRMHGIRVVLNSGFEDNLFPFTGGLKKGGEENVGLCSLEERAVMLKVMEGLELLY